MAHKVNIKDIEWEREGILYRGNFQYNLEYMLIKGWLNNQQAYYQGNAKNKDKNRITFVTSFLCDPSSYCVYNIEKRFNIEEYSPFSVYPCIMAINALNYADKIYESTQGEGIYIDEKISEKDIIVVWGLGIDRISKFYPTNADNRIKESIDRSKQFLLNAIKMYDLQNKSFLERFKEQGTEMDDLMFYLFGPRLQNYSDTEKDSVERAVKKLEEFYQKSSFAD